MCVMEECICTECLRYHEAKCPYGECRDDWRARNDPYVENDFDKRYRPGSWSNYYKPMEKEHWCRAGRFFPARECGHFIRYDDDQTRVADCIGAPVTIYQDGFVRCSLVDMIGCAECMARNMSEEDAT